MAYASGPENDIAFRANEWIGELVGEIFPLTKAMGNTMFWELSDPETGAPTCRVNSHKKGNWVRLVNHSCKPTARFKTVIVGGRVRLLLVAAEDIFHSVEITADLANSPMFGMVGSKVRSCATCNGRCTAQRAQRPEPKPVVPNDDEVDWVDMLD